jgi:hypothetical protein
MNLKAEEMFMNNFQKISKEEYQNFFNKALFGTFFHNLEWHEFLEKEFKWLKFEYYRYKDEALLIFGRVGDKLISLPFCEYGGPLPLPARLSSGEGGKREINFDEFKDNVLSEFGENIKIKFHPEILKYFRGSENNQNTESNNFTSWIEEFKNATEELLLGSFRKTLRHEIRNSQKENLAVKKCENLKELKEFYNLYIANLKRKKTIPYPFSVVEFLYKNRDTEIILAVKSNKIIGGNLFINYGKFVHYFLSVSDLKYRDLGPNYLLLWTKIKGLIGQDKILDLGATPKNSSLDVFKHGWGGKEYPIIQIGIKKSSEALRTSKLRDIWGLLPDFIIKKMSHFLIKYRL